MCTCNIHVSDYRRIWVLMQYTQLLKENVCAHTICMREWVIDCLCTHNMHTRVTQEECVCAHKVHTWVTNEYVCKDLDDWFWRSTAQTKMSKVWERELIQSLYCIVKYLPSVSESSSSDGRVSTLSSMPSRSNSPSASTEGLRAACHNNHN